jgi:hypothetical protein
VARIDVRIYGDGFIGTPGGTAEMKITEDKFILRRQLAKELGEMMRGRGYTERALIEWEKRGIGPPAIRIGRDVVYRVAGVAAWLRSQEEPVA